VNRSDRPEDNTVTHLLRAFGYSAPLFSLTLSRSRLSRRIAMKSLALMVTLGTLATAMAGDAKLPPANPAINMTAHIKLTENAAKHRETRRLSEEDFLKMSQEPGVIVLDARSKDKYDRLHIEGAINLSFPDLDINSLAKAIPNKKATILIYCNNNFLGALLAFAPKSAPVSLNLSTYTTLFGYGYENVYELAPLLDVNTTKLPFAGTDAKTVRATK
jgi:hypothetical protein